MDEKQYQLEIINQLAINEERLSGLYAKYATIFEAHATFWRELALDEVGHGKWIRTLQRRVEEGAVLFGSDRFNIDMMNDFYQRVRQEELRADQDMTLLDALTVADEMEKTMIEQKFFEVFAGDAHELEIVLLALEYSTKNHRQHVEKALREEQGSEGEKSQPQLTIHP